MLVPGPLAVAHDTEPGPAGEDVFHFVGGGFGHGVGMSQYGALGRAEAGFTYPEILDFYYDRVDTLHAPELIPDSVRVLIGVHNTTKFTPQGQLTVAMDGEFLDVTVNQLTVTREEGGWLINSSNIDWCRGFCPGEVLTVSFSDGEPVSVSATANGTRRYAYGQFQLTPAAPGVQRCGSASGNQYCLVVGELGVQEYLYGVDEMPYTWHREALKAQAVAARSFVVARMQKRSNWNSPFDVYTSTRDQEYHAWDHESEPLPARPWADMVDATEDVVMVHTPVPASSGGDTEPYVIVAFHSSSNGGHTASPTEPWMTELPYLSAKPDSYDAAPDENGAPQNPLHLWHRVYLRTDVSRWLADYPDADLSVGELQQIIITGEGPSGRIDDALVTLVGSERTLEVRDRVGDPFGYRFYRALEVGCLATPGCEPMLSTKVMLSGQPPDLSLISLPMPEDDAVREHQAQLVNGSELYFADVSPDAPYAEAVAWLSGHGITHPASDTEFSPDAPVTRAQFAVWLWRIAGRPTVGTPAPFDDVDADSHYAEAVAWMVDSGITQGCAAGLFCPHRQLTEAQAATLLWRFAGSPISRTSMPFVDIQAGDYYVIPVRWMLQWDLWVDQHYYSASHRTTLFNPDHPASRARLSVYLWNLAAAPGAMPPEFQLPASMHRK